jgi:hypothetical protein
MGGNMEGKSGSEGEFGWPHMACNPQEQGNYELTRKIKMRKIEEEKNSSCESAHHCATPSTDHKQKNPHEVFFFVCIFFSRILHSTQ